MKTFLLTFTAMLGTLFFIGCRAEQKQELLSQQSCQSCSISPSSVQAEGVITIFKDDGSKFFTSQTHLICLCDNSILIKTTTADGEAIFKLDANGNFNYSGISLPANSPLNIFDKQIAGLILEMLIAAKSDHTIINSDPVNIYGQWYHKTSTQKNGYAFYENLDTNRLDLIISKDYFAKGYDYKNSSALTAVFPATIEISSVGKNNSPGVKVLKIEYTDIMAH
jgi:hypothetical protein